MRFMGIAVLIIKKKSVYYSLDLHCQKKTDFFPHGQFTWRRLLNGQKHCDYKLIDTEKIELH